MGLIHSYPNLVYNDKFNLYSGYVMLPKTMDSYNVLLYCGKFPDQFPIVFETNERIPIKAHRHCNKNGSLCFTTSAKEDILLATKIKTIKDFIDLILVPYLENNSFYEINKRYKYDEHSHDLKRATYETYKDLLNISNIYEILNTIDKLIRKEKLRPNEKCYCNSNLKIKICTNHYNAYKICRKIKKYTLETDKLRIEEIISIIKNPATNNGS